MQNIIFVVNNHISAHKVSHQLRLPVAGKITEYWCKITITNHIKLVTLSWSRGLINVKIYIHSNQIEHDFSVCVELNMNASQQPKDGQLNDCNCLVGRKQNKEDEMTCYMCTLSSSAFEWKNNSFLGVLHHILATWLPFSTLLVNDDINRTISLSLPALCHWWWLVYFSTFPCQCSVEGLTHPNS